MRIVVLGGSFNPPTMAHLNIMQSALNAIGGERGIFVPVSYAYLKRKMSRGNSTFCLSEELRRQMLEVLCTEDGRLEVCDFEYKHPLSRTYDTMVALQSQYPDDELYFLMGADKLHLAREMELRCGFLSRFRIALFARENVSLQQEIYADAILGPLADRIRIFPQQEEIDGISSTAVRQAFLTGQSTQALVHPGVRKLLETVKPEDFPPEITRFREEYAFLDPLFPSPILWDGITYSCVEAAFQASKTNDTVLRKQFASMRADKIKARGRTLSVSSQWEAAKRQLMKQLNRQKFTSSPELAQKLKDTGATVLINGNNGKDLFWGTDLYTWEGKNELGMILMEVRDEIFFKMGD